MPFNVQREEILFEIDNITKVKAVLTEDGREYVDIRKYFQNAQGDTLPTSKGIMLAKNKWEELAQNLPAIVDKVNEFFA